MGKVSYRSQINLVSDDGYLRLNKESLSNVQLRHLISGFHEFEEPSSRVESSQTTMAGFSEWISETSPVVSVAWDWILVPFRKPLLYEVSGPPYSNIMLVSDDWQDMGINATNLYLLELITKLHWHEAISASISKMYRGQPVIPNSYLIPYK